MLDWFAFALISTVAAGLQGFLYKKAADQGCNSATLMTSYIAAVIFLAAGALVFVGGFQVSKMFLFFLFAVVNALAYVVRFLFRLEALKHIPLVVGLPLMKMSAAVAAVVGVIFFGESLNFLNVIGIVSALAVVSLLNKREEDDSVGNWAKGLFFVGLVVLAASIGDVAVKLVSSEGNQFLFMVITYGFMFLPSIGLQERFSSIEETTRGTALRWGAIIGAVNFVSFSSLLTALATGPMSIIFPMTTLSMALSVVLSVVLLGENLTKRRSIGIIIALFALILLRL